MEFIVLLVAIWIFWRWRKSRRVKLNSVLDRVVGKPKTEGFAVLDFETTGLSPSQGDRIVQVAVVLLSADGWYQGHWSSLVNPQRDVGPTHIHGITNEAVEKSPLFSDVLPTLQGHLKGRVIVAHNARFDLNFFFWESHFAGVPQDTRGVRYFDTMSLAREIFPYAPDKKMETLVGLTGVNLSKLPGRGFHDALFDVYAEAELLKYYMSHAPQEVASHIHPVSSLKFSELDDRHLDALKELRAMEAKAAKILAELGQAPILELSLDTSGEVVFLGLWMEERREFETWSSEAGLKAGDRVLKSRTKLVVVGSGDFNKKPLLQAFDWGIPIVTIHHMRGSRRD